MTTASTPLPGLYLQGSTTPLLTSQKKLTSTNPTIGLRYVPHEAWILRASYGTGFLPPDLSQLAPIVIPGLTTPVIDPRRGDSLVAQASTAAWAIPIWVRKNRRAGRRASCSRRRPFADCGSSLDYTRIEKTDAITYLQPQGIVDNENLFPGRVVRAAPADSDPLSASARLPLSTPAA